MSFRIDRIARPITARQSSKARGDQDREETSRLLPVPVSAPVEPPRPDRRAGDNGFAAQMLGQDGQKRGLRAGQPAIDAARSAYSQIEWSGAQDRRRRSGRAAQTKI
jgi:hypothetical protein